jgi:putative ABC transport system permease protein
MLKSYLKIACKVLLRRKAFTLISLFGIAVTLLVLTVAAALLDHAFGPLPPETRQDRTLGVYFVTMNGPKGKMTGPPGYGLLERTLRDLPGVENISIFQLSPPVVSYVDGRKIESRLKRTDWQFWQILEFEFLEGGSFTPQDERDGSLVAVISAETRRRFFGGEPALGRSITADGQSFRVVGVVRNVSILRIVPTGDIWVPIGTLPSSGYRERLVGDFMAILLAQDRSRFGAIRSEYAMRLSQIPLPEDYDTLIGGAETFFEAISRMLVGDFDADRSWGLRTVLFVLMVLFMLLPSVNLVNLNLSRILERASEIGVRRAFGASSLTLVGQFLVENVVLSLFGALLGFGLAWGALGLINDSGFIPYAHLTLNGRVFLAGMAMAVFFGLLSGALPAWRMSKLPPVQVLRGRSL